MRRLLAGIAVPVLLASGLLTWHGLAAVTGVAPMDRPAITSAQRAWLLDSADYGAARRMQELFPEGYLFTVVLTGLAVGQVAAPGSEQAANITFDQLARADSPEGVAPFGPITSPPHGAFHAGWSLLLAVEHAQASQNATAVESVRRRAEALKAAFDASPNGLLESYPGQTWPCDAVVAMAALHRAGEIVPLNLDRTTARWQVQLDRLRDERGLLPHRTTPTGRILEGPRATSQVIIQRFWPDIEPVDGRHGAATTRHWQSFVDTFVVREFGVIGVREYPPGVTGTGDVDSGPLVFGLSASASVVAIGAARANGDLQLAADLDRGAELVGGGVTFLGQRFYAAGQLPVGDAFLLWARTTPAPPVTVTTDHPRPQWFLPVGVFAVPGLLAGLLLWRLRRPVAWPATPQPPGWGRLSRRPQGSAGVVQWQNSSFPSC